jgi:hypothetical protein
LLDLDWDEPAAENPISPILQDQGGGSSSFNDLLSIGSEMPQQNTAPNTTSAPRSNNNVDDIMSLFNSSTPSQQPQQQMVPQSNNFAPNNNITTDFTNDLFGDAFTTNTNTQQQEQPKPTNTAPAKDPFADLF